VIGKGAAVGIAFKKLQLGGYLAWLAWLAIHITFLVGFRNRIAVLFNWAYVYFTGRRHAQLIVGDQQVPREPVPKAEAEAEGRPSTESGSFDRSTGSFVASSPSPTSVRKG
jgi:NADH dehydrogenase